MPSIPPERPERGALPFRSWRRLAISALTIRLGSRRGMQRKRWGDLVASPQRMRSDARWRRSRTPGKIAGTNSVLDRAAPVLAAEGMIEYALMNALSRGEAWVSGTEKLERLRGWCSPWRQTELAGSLADWAARAIHAVDELAAGRTIHVQRRGVLRRKLDEPCAKAASISVRHRSR